MNNLLFIYGSLLADDNEFANYLRRNSDFVTKATFKGRLYNIGDYPGAVLDFAGYDVHGVICNLSYPDEALKLLDEYEGFGDAEEQPNLFVRTIIEATTGAGKVDCWVYLYNLSAMGLTEIITGNYATYQK